MVATGVERDLLRGFRGATDAFGLSLRHLRARVATGDERLQNDAANVHTLKKDAGFKKDAGKK